MADQEEVHETGPEETTPDATGSDETGTDETGTDEEETRRRFREALEAKRQRQHASAEAAVHDGSEKSHGATGPTKGRTFRRKSI